MRGRCSSRPALAMDARTLKTELDAAGYRETATARVPGTYTRDGGRFAIASRGFQRRRRRGRRRAASRRRCRAAACAACAMSPASARSDPRGSIRRASPRCTAQKQEERRLVRAGGSAAAAGHRPAGGRGPRLRAPPRHRPRRHAARGLVNVKSRRGEAGRQHADPAARALRPARHRPRADLQPQVQRDPVRAADRGALRQARDPRGLPQPGLPRPARRAGDPRRRRRRPSSGSDASSTT